MRRIPVWSVWLAGLVPLALLVADALGGQLGVDPVRDVEHRLGRTAIYLLAATLAVTPLRRWLGVNLLRHRRTLGRLTFLYAVLHVTAWVVIDMGLTWPQIARDVVKRPYLVFGMAGLALLLPLALTSSDRAIRWLGSARWRALHRLVYPAAVLAGAHWLWALKLWEPWPLAISGAILALLMLRLQRRRPPEAARISVYQQVARNLTGR